MMRLDLTRAECPFAAMRAAVEAGEPDQPVTVYHGGKAALTVASMHRGACLTVAEEPYVRFVPYAPHPRAVIGPRLAAVLAADKQRRADAREAAKTALEERAARVAAEIARAGSVSEAV